MTVFSIHRILQFILDIVLVLWFFRTLQDKRISRCTRSLCCLVLLPLGVLYFINFSGSLLVTFLLRFVLRATVYFLYLYLVKDASCLKDMYCSLFATAIITTCQNVLFSPILLPIAMGRLEFINNALINELLCFVIQGVFYAIVFCLIIKHVPLSWIEEKSHLQWVLLVVTIIIQMYVKVSLGFAVGGPETSESFSVFSVILCLLMLSLLVFIIRYSYSMRKLKEAELQDISNRYYLEKLQTRIESSETIRSLHHDIKNHMIAIKKLAQNQNDDQIDQYIDELLSGVERSEFVYDTGNDLLDGLFSEKATRAAKEKIQMEILADFRDLDFIKNNDLCTIFGNALDNAIEACEKIQDVTERYIRIKTEKAAGQLMIYIINPAVSVAETEEGILKTTKKDASSHGYGYRNMLRAVKKYDGLLNHKNKDGLFILSIILPLLIQ